MGETSDGDLVEVRVDPRTTPATPTTMRRASDTSAPSRVRQLAKRFEPVPFQCPPPIPLPKRIGKFRIRSNGEVIIRRVSKKNSLKRKAYSHPDISKSRTSTLRKTTSSTFPTGNVPHDCNIVSSHQARRQLSENTSENETAHLQLNSSPVPTPRTRNIHSFISQSSSPLVSRRDPQPTYRESYSVSLTLAAKSPPPLIPDKPPSLARIRRIPSHLQPVPKERLKKSDDKEEDNYEELPYAANSNQPESEKSMNNTEIAPSIPSVPPPQRPPSKSERAEKNDGSLSDDCYEDIDGLCPESAPSTSSNGGSDKYVTRIYCENVNYPNSEGSEICTQNIYCKCATCRRFSQIHMNFRRSEDADKSITSTLQRYKKTMRRPVSTIEFDKLIKFKSEIQLNLSKKMERLRENFSDRHGKRKIGPKQFNLSASSLSTDDRLRLAAERSRMEDDAYIYGDDWSSDEEEDDDDRRSSMYKELEETLNDTFPQSKSRNEANEIDAENIMDPRNSLDTTELSRRISSISLNTSEGDKSNGEEAREDEDFSRQYTSRVLPTDQPLYQHYIIQTQEEMLEQFPTEGLNQIESTTVLPESRSNEKEDSEKKAFRRESSTSSDSGRGGDASTSASALTSNTSMRRGRDRLVATSGFGSQRSLWCELAEVKSAGLLESLDEDSKIRQEAYFEVITSEASYLRSLNVLITHFMASPHLMGHAKSAQSVISSPERKHLFSNIFAVRDCSERLLIDLESRLEESIVLDDICDILTLHFEKHFDVYVKYCSNQVYQDRTLRKLKTENNQFLQCLQRLEENKICQGLDMRSFLMLPMQRITRYPLLLYAILDRLPPESDKYATAAKALNSANKIVRECNEGARRMERTEQLLDIERRLVYKDPQLRRMPLVSKSRYLVKRGALTQIVERRGNALLQGRSRTRNIHVFLFSDMIMITKKKVNGTYTCKDYAERKFVDMEPIEPDNPKIPQGAISSLAGRPHLFLCVLMRNARGKQTELLLSADSETDRERWLSSVRPPTSANPEERIYAEWDCPQAVAVHAYSKSQDDELELQIGDIINILRKMPDGWFYGEKQRDGTGGWFPSSYVQQVLNDHVRARNYRQRLRIIKVFIWLKSSTLFALL
ncbi:hypothetical protein WR25_02347 isoform A [Diploscapter pachys]|uniref:DH domain-containing protein n=2 Tax=Diploscapter pachys TaxID=2018661 RepID=A0A2A2K121_9BILA|nr:hypothetical protein WR25_02347 isoform A [Diploscapter pachys]